MRFLSLVVIILFAFSCSSGAFKGAKNIEIEFDPKYYDLLVAELMRSADVHPSDSGVYVKSQVYYNNYYSPTAYPFLKESKYITCDINRKKLKDIESKAEYKKDFLFSDQFKTVNFQEIRQLQNTNPTDSGFFIVRLHCPIHICDNLWYMLIPQTSLSGDGPLYNSLIQVDSNSVKIIDVQFTGGYGIYAD